LGGGSANVKLSTYTEKIDIHASTGISPTTPLFGRSITYIP